MCPNCTSISQLFLIPIFKLAFLSLKDGFLRPTISLLSTTISRRECFCHNFIIWRPMDMSLCFKQRISAVHGAVTVLYCEWKERERERERESNGKYALQVAARVCYC